MRESILESFNRIDVIDLHGNIKKKEVSPTGSNENVFPIQQGVCINILKGLQLMNNELLMQMFGEPKLRNLRHYKMMNLNLKSLNHHHQVISFIRLT